MIAIDLGCVNEPGSASMIVSELMERQMFQQNLDPPKGFKFQPPRPWEDSGLQVLYIYIYVISSVYLSIYMHVYTIDTTGVPHASRQPQDRPSRLPRVPTEGIFSGPVVG